MERGSFKIVDIRPVRELMTVSRDAGLESVNGVTYFSMGAGTTISQESYDTKTIYIGAHEQTIFLLGTEASKVKVGPGELLFVPDATLCGMESTRGSVYTEIILNKEATMNSVVKAGEAIQLKNLISYEEGSIANMDIVSNDTMKFVIMAFDEGTGLTPHRAPGNAIITALEGKAIIGYEGKDYELKEGECFRFDKNGLHSVTAQGKFKMSLLLVLK